MKKLKKIYYIAGARPNMIKIAPIMEEMNKFKNIFLQKFIHTGQHYSASMGNPFSKACRMPNPDINLNASSGTAVYKISKTISLLEKLFVKNRPDLVIVVGDVDSTLAGALTASKLDIPIAHVEAGLRSFDRRMPEEINRIITDCLSEYLFITSPEAKDNLINENISNNRIYFTGNVMIDSLHNFLKSSEKSRILGRLALTNKHNEVIPYFVLTLHRPSNVDDKNNFLMILDALGSIQKKIRVIFPAHPRSKESILKFKLGKHIDKMNNFMIVPPLPYLDFLKLYSHSKCVLTDSGGLQEETTVLGIPCLTLRDNTERPITVSIGTNKIIGTNPDKIVREADKIIQGKGKQGTVPKYWDGKASKRIIKILINKFA